MAKKAKHEHRIPNLSPIAALRPRLDGLIHNPGWLQRGIDSTSADLDAVTKQIQPADYLPVLLRAFSDNNSNNKDQYIAVLSAWLQQEQRLVVLQQIVAKNLLSGDSLQLALALLQDADIEVALSAPSSFYKAFYGDDDFGSQGFLIILWYTNQQKTRVSGVNFLRDFNPPWDGAIKDSFQFPQRSPQDAVRQYVDRMRQGRITIREVGDVRAKQLMIECFRCNQAQSIRPSRDTIALRNVILDKIFTLPDDESTPLFTIDEFDRILTIGKTADEIMQYEKTVGRRVRLEDGKEILIMGADDDWDLP